MLVVFVERGEGTQTEQKSIENTLVPLKISWAHPSLLQGACMPNPLDSGMLSSSFRLTRSDFAHFFPTPLPVTSCLGWELEIGDGKSVYTMKSGHYYTSEIY